MSNLHQFDNRMRIRAQDLGAGRISRYTAPGAINLHEPVEESWFLAVLQNLGGGVFFDVGAAVGYYSILCGLTRSDVEVHAFELLEDHRAAIVENLAINNLAADRVTIHEKAIATKDGEISFMAKSYGSSIFPLGDGGHSDYFSNYFGLGDNAAPDNSANARQMPAISLEHAIKTYGTSPIFIKMDVQGAEADLIKSAESVLSDNLVDYWIIGTHTEDIHLQVAALMAPHVCIELNEFDVAQQPDGLIVARSPNASSVTPIR